MVRVKDGHAPVAQPQETRFFLPTLIPIGGMGRFCWICGRRQANEKFSGRGHGMHECRGCRQKTTPEKRAALRALADLTRILEQKSISPRNVAFAESFAEHADDELRALARIVAAVGRIHPARRRRNAFIARNRPDLRVRMVAAGAWPEEEFLSSRRDPSVPWNESGAAPAFPTDFDDV